MLGGGGLPRSGRVSSRRPESQASVQADAERHVQRPRASASVRRPSSRRSSQKMAGVSRPQEYQRGSESTSATPHGNPAS